MATKNDITGDNISTKVGKAKKKFDEGMKLIKPSCLPDCKYLVGTLTKCRACDWNPKNADVQK
jgi:hypothetical protein